MIEDFAQRVDALYNGASKSSGEERDRRIYELTLYLAENWDYSPRDPLANPARPISYQVIRLLNGSEDVRFHLQERIRFIESFRLQRQFSDLFLEDLNISDPYYQWFNAHQKKYVLSAKSSVADVLNAVDEVRSTLIAANLEIDSEFNFSMFVVNRFKLDQRGKELKAVLNGVTNNRDHQLRLIAHLCTIQEKSAPYLTWLDQEELKKVASHFYNVPCFSEEIPEEWFKSFLKLCVNARSVHIKVPIKSLDSDDLPPHVEMLYLTMSQCNKVSLSLPKLKECTFSRNNFNSVDLNAPRLQSLKINECQNLTTLRLNTPHLEHLDLNRISVDTLTLDTPFLSELLITHDANLEAIRIVHPDRLRFVSFEGCTSLRSILEPGRGIPNCRTLILYDCPAAVPQVPSTAEVFTGTRRAKGDVLSFRVNPKLLDENPLQVLLDFGKIFEKQGHFPNIVWINPLTGAEAPGVDAGGLRRHFVAALTDKLPSTLEDKLALETFGRLIGFAAESSLLLGRSLPLEFYYELLSGDDSLKEVLEGVKASLGPHWEKWKRNPEESDADFATKVRIFADQVQGKPVTAENLLPLLHFNGFEFAKTKEYFKQFFKEFPLLVDERVFQLKHFHQMLLGSLSLEGRPITIHVTGAGEALPSIHACSGEMETPTYKDYQTFKEKLMWAFRAHDTFETI